MARGISGEEALALAREKILAARAAKAAKLPPKREYRGFRAPRNLDDDQTADWESSIDERLDKLGSREIDRKLRLDAIELSAYADEVAGRGREAGTMATFDPMASIEEGYGGYRRDVGE